MSWKDLKEITLLTPVTPVWPFDPWGSCDINGRGSLLLCPSLMVIAQGILELWPIEMLPERKKEERTRHDCVINMTRTLPIALYSHMLIWPFFNLWLLKVGVNPSIFEKFLLCKSVINYYFYIEVYFFRNGFACWMWWSCQFLTKMYDFGPRAKIHIFGAKIFWKA